MGKLDHFIAGQAGHFRRGEEDSFPWDRADSTIWYCLLVIEKGKIAQYGFTASKSNKGGLFRALSTLKGREDALLLGIWHGQYRTDLFILDIGKAIEALKVYGERSAGTKDDRAV